ncbi:GDSL esterase/lipase At2g40250-like [Nicotiana tomentosiformis]|uniref:GDSL esterase/lipase At2g40250-like n=1 Tax=Nicotiana tomentosiformis TaxID=4098 RepID=UPI00051AD6FE|nr:GDSL esterase/lipase At2g40250-like [Nicotiana tomentosiformis]
MQAKTTLFFFLIPLFNLFFQPHLTNASSTNITAIFAFGDSVFDPGNNNALPTLFRANHWPYGKDFPGQVPTGRCSNGKLTTDILVSLLGIKQLLPAYLDPKVSDKDLLTGVSFASGGSGLDELTAKENNVLSMVDQLNYFEQSLKRMQKVVGGKEAERIVEKALFMISAGTNDMLFNFYDLPTRRYISLSGYHDFLLNRLEAFVNELYKMGAKKIAVVGLPPIGCLPVQVTINSLLPSFHMFQRVCVQQQNFESQSYNKKLQALISRLRSTLSGSKLVYTDVYNPLLDIIQKPSAYGYDHILEACCGTGSLEMGPLCNEFNPTCVNPSRYLLWDAVHPTQATNEYLVHNFQRTVLPQLVD